VDGTIYLLAFGPRVLPHRGSVTREWYDPREYTVEMLVEPKSSLVGQTIEEAKLRNLPGLYLVEIDRQGEVLPAVGPTERLHAEDRLVFAGQVDSVVYLQKMRGLRPATDQVFRLDSPRAHRCLIEAVVSNTCPLAGQTVREGKFRTVYNAAIIAVARNGERLREKIGDIRLRAGDTLLLEAHTSFLEQQRNSRDFFLISQVENSTPPRHERAWLALAILAGMVVVAVGGWLTLVNASLLAATVMVLTRCCSGTEARRSVDWQVLVVIAASLGIGRAMQVSGAAQGIAVALLGLVPDNPWVALVVVYLLTLVFTEIMSHYAGAVLIFPIALATAGTLHVSFLPFAMAMMIAASCGFATPIGHQTNLMVMGPGGYRFSDFVRIGAPLNLVIAAVAIVLIPLLWPFYP
jgi:di/tricarboxylate transporter